MADEIMPWKVFESAANEIIDEGENSSQILVKVMEKGEIVNKDALDFKKARELVYKQMEVAKAAKTTKTVKAVKDETKAGTYKSFSRGLWCTDLLQL